MHISNSILWLNCWIILYGCYLFFLYMSNLLLKCLMIKFFIHEFCLDLIDFCFNSCLTSLGRWFYPEIISFSPFWRNSHAVHIDLYQFNRIKLTFLKTDVSLLKREIRFLFPSRLNEYVISLAPSLSVKLDEIWNEVEEMYISLVSL